MFVIGFTHEETEYFLFDSSPVLTWSTNIEHAKRFTSTQEAETWLAKTAPTIVGKAYVLAPK